MALALELGKVVDHQTAEEGAAIVKRGLIDDNLGAFGLNALHNALDTALTEIVAVALHCQAVHADDAFALLSLVPAIVVVVIGIVPSSLEHLVGDKILAGLVAIHDGADKVLRHIGIVGQKLLRVLGQAIAAIAETGVVVVAAYTGIEAHAIDNLLGVESLEFGIGVQLVEIANTQCQVGVGEKFDGLGLGAAHLKHWYLLLNGAALDKLGKHRGFLAEQLTAVIVAHDDARRIEVVVERLRFTKELGSKENVDALELFLHRGSVAHGYGALDDHHRIRVDLQHLLDDIFHG